jgi:hypothetical protein
MANRHRGEISAEFSGKTYTLCLTLGALAELEDSFGASDISGLAEKFENSKLSSRDILKIIACGLRGAGHDITDEEVASLKVYGGLQDYVRIAARLLAAAFGESQEHGISANPPSPQEA